MTSGGSARIALGALRVHKLRSALTMLGIVIGVAEVILLIALVQGAHDRVVDQIQRLGSNLIVVLPGVSRFAGTSGGRASGLTLAEDDVGALLRDAPSVRLAAPVITGKAQVVNGNLNWPSFLRGTTPEYLVARDWAVRVGRPFTPRDVEAVARVALVGETVAHELFGDADPVGQDIRIRNVPFGVLGVLERKGQTSWGEDLDDVIVVPISTARNRLGAGSPVQPRAVNAILVQIHEGRSLAVAERQITDVLRQQHRLRDEQPDDFWLQNFIEVLETADATTAALTVLLVAVAAVSLLVGGIGIMNIMLVSVTERTREIGVRMAVGARRRDIMFQFLAEAVTLALIGGGLGVAVGLAAAAVFTHLADWRILVPIEMIGLAFLFSGAVGVFFGFYPARRASRLHPIDALRHE